LRNDGVGSWIARRARRTPDRAAVIHGAARLSYAQLHDRVTRLAHGLRGLGAGRGDRVAYLGPNHPAFLETLFAAGTLGAPTWSWTPTSARTRSPWWSLRCSTPPR
jgi:fatty-acyl-CoA synthase